MKKLKRILCWLGIHEIWEGVVPAMTGKPQMEIKICIKCGKGQKDGEWFQFERV